MVAADDLPVMDADGELEALWNDVWRTSVDACVGVLDVDADMCALARGVARGEVDGDNDCERVNFGVDADDTRDFGATS